MNQKTKPDKKNAEELAPETSEEEKTEKRSYYYDDAHNYEIYDPDKDDEND